MCVYPLSLILFIHALLPPDSQQKKAKYIVHTHYISLYTHDCLLLHTLVHVTTGIHAVYAEVCAVTTLI